MAGVSYQKNKSMQSGNLRKRQEIKTDFFCESGEGLKDQASGLAVMIIIRKMFSKLLKKIKNNYIKSLLLKTKKNKENKETFNLEIISAQSSVIIST